MTTPSDEPPMRVTADDGQRCLAVAQPQDVALEICPPAPGTRPQLAAAPAGLRVGPTACRQRGPCHGPHNARCRVTHVRRPQNAGGLVVVLLLQVIGAERCATDAAGAVVHEQLGTMFTDLAGALGRGGRQRAHGSLRRRCRCQSEP